MEVEMTAGLVERRRRLGEIEGRLRQLQADAARTMWEYGALLAEVEREELWRDDGLDSFPAWVEDRMGISRRGAGRAMALAAHFTAEMAERFGTSKLEATVAYMEATNRIEKPGEVLALKFRVRSGSRYRSVPFAEATVRQIEEARRLVVEARQRRPEVDVGVRARVDRLVADLPPPPRGARGQRVRVVEGDDGDVSYSFASIRHADLPAFIDALRQHLVD